MRQFQSTAEIEDEDGSDGLVSNAIDESAQTSGEKDNTHIKNTLNAKNSYSVKAS